MITPKSCASTKNSPLSTNLAISFKKYPQGREVLSQENQQVFVLNGIQTQSGYCYNLILITPKSCASTKNSPLSTNLAISFNSEGACNNAKVERTTCLPLLATSLARLIQS